MARPNWDRFTPIRHEERRRAMGPVLKGIMYCAAFLVGGAVAVFALLMFLDDSAMVPALPGGLIYVPATRIIIAVGIIGGILGVVGLWKILREAASSQPPRR